MEITINMNAKTPRCFSRAFIMACSAGDESTAKDIYCRFKKYISCDNPEDIIKAFCEACGYGHETIAKWIYSLYDSGDIKWILREDKAFIFACKNGHDSIAKWLNTVIDDITSESKVQRIYAAFYNACVNGHDSIAKWLYDIKLDNGLKIVTNVLNKTEPIPEIIGEGMYYRGCSMETPSCFIDVCENGHEAIAKWLYSVEHEYAIQTCGIAFQMASESNHESIALWLYSVGGDTFDDDVYEYASDTTESDIIREKIKKYVCKNERQTM